MAKYCLEVAFVLGARGRSPRPDAIVINLLPPLMQALLCVGTFDAPDAEDSDEARCGLLLDLIRRTGKSGNVRVEYAAVGTEISPYTSRWVNAPGATIFELHFDDEASQPFDDLRPAPLTYLVVLRRRRASEGHSEGGSIAVAGDAPPELSHRRAHALAGDRAHAEPGSARAGRLGLCDRDAP